MTLSHEWGRLSRRTRRNIALGAAVLTVAIAAGIALLSRDTGAGMPRGQARPTDPSGTQGMQGMDMGGGTVTLTPGQLAEFGIPFGFAEMRTLSAEVRTVGIVNFDETRVAQVTPKVSGFVERLYIDFTGKPVRRGQALLELYSPDLVSAQEELLLAARIARTGAPAIPGVPAQSADLIESAKMRLRLWDISEAQINEVLRTGRVKRTLTLHAPVNGVVVDKQVLRGQGVQPGQALYTIADLSRVWVEAELREADAATVREGAAATVELSALPGRRLQGRVEYVYPTLEADARTLKARIAMPNPENRIKPGMFAVVRLSAPVRTALTVPTSAVVQTGERSIVFVDMGNQRIMPHDVITGRSAGDLTEIISGLEPGQRVVTAAQFLLDSESNLGEVMRSMIGTMGADMDMPGMNMPREKQ